MSSLINSFLRTEITVIPQAVRKIFGNYNNTLTNAATWMFAIWTALHYIFDRTVNSLLLKMQYREFLRIRLADSIWNLGFYSSCFWYCSATLYKNHIDLFNQKPVIGADHDEISGNFVFGYILLITYVLHAAARDITRHGLCMMSASNFCLSIFLLTTCFTRKLELSFALLAILSFSQSGIELVRCLISLLKDHTKMTKFLSKLLLIISVFLILLSHGFTIPVVIIIPLGHHLLLKPTSGNLWLLNFTIWLWVCTEVFNNVVYKLIRHIIIHKKTEKPKSCLGSTVECSLFFPRDDVAYHLKIVRQEIEERRQGQLGMRKPKNKNVLFQTLKSVAMLSMMAENSTDTESVKNKTTVEMLRDGECLGMMAIRRKLYQKRLAESSDSESESENVSVVDPNSPKKDTEEDLDDTIQSHVRDEMPWMTDTDDDDIKMIDDDLQAIDDDLQSIEYEKRNFDDNVHDDDEENVALIQDGDKKIMFSKQTEDGKD